MRACRPKKDHVEKHRNVDESEREEGPPRLGGKRDQTTKSLIHPADEHRADEQVILIREVT